MKEVKKRIVWVDIAKAFTILSVPFAHTIPIEWTMRTMIFSFHMPLFFILSGFTTRLATNWNELLKRLKKNFIYLILPTLAVLAIFTITDAIKQGGIYLFPEKIVYWLREFFLDPYPEGLYTAGAVWFLVALFWAKLIMDFINVVFKTEKNGLIFFILGIAGVFMGVYGLRPPAFFDLGLVGAFFMYLGTLWRKHEKIIEKYALPISLVAGVYWFSHTMRGDFMELWLRFYGGYEVSFLVAIAGTFLVSRLAIFVEESSRKSGKIIKTLKDALVVLGKNTFLLYLVHSLDWCLFEKLWNFCDGSNKMLAISLLARFAVDFAGFFILLGLKKLLARKSISLLKKS